MREERTYQQEVSAMEKKFESWSQLPAPAMVAAEVKKAASAVTVSLPPAVAAFEVLLCITGYPVPGSWFSDLCHFFACLY